MMRGAVSDITKAVGHTPVVKLNRVADGIESSIYVKCEYLNPGGSHKDRVAITMIRDAEAHGLKPGGTIVEATSGNTGAALAMVAAIKGYKCVFVMPDKMSQEKVATLRAFGARVVVCPTAVEPEDPRSYYQVARRIAEETPNCFYANQYHNPSNPNAHYVSTGPEIWEQCGHELDVFVAGMGTGGAISGTGKFLRLKKPDMRLVGVDPVGSLYYDFVKSGRITKPFTYKVEGIGEDFFPSTMNLKIIDEIIRVDDKECFLTTRQLVREEGIFCGGSCGAAVAGAIRYAEHLSEPKNILVLLPDSAQKYLSKIFDDKWMTENGFLEEPDPLGQVADMLRGRADRPVIAIRRQDSIGQAIALLKNHGVSQLPVMDEGRLAGLVSELDLLNWLLAHPGQLDHTVSDLVEADYATVTQETKVKLLRTIFNDAKVVCVLEGDSLIGVITKIDLIDYLATRTAAA